MKMGRETKTNKTTRQPKPKESQPRMHPEPKSRKHPKAKSENPKNVQNLKHEYSETLMRTKPNPMSNVIVPNQEGLKQECY